MTDNRTTELLYAVNEDGIRAYCPFDSEASCGNWCPMLGHEGGRWFCTLSITRTVYGQCLMLVPKSQLLGRPYDDRGNHE